MPQVEGAPKGLNKILEDIYQACMKEKGSNKDKCSRIAWEAAKNDGWRKNQKGEWTKS